MSVRTSLGWIPDLPDHRDHAYVAPAALLAQPPRRVDLRPRCPPVLHQGLINACTAHAIANAHLFDQVLQKQPAPFLPSRLFIYWNERVALGIEATDAGATIRGGIKAIAKLGACPEELWNYDSSLVLKPPPTECFEQALAHRAIAYRRLSRDLKHLCACLAEGWPFLFGFTTYESFHSPQVKETGVLPMPQRHERIAGGHAALAVGFDASARTFLVMNSWGAAWGQDGCFTVPFDYLLHEHLARDFWTLRSVA